jgi:hypothetical protein
MLTADQLVELLEQHGSYVDISQALKVHDKKIGNLARDLIRETPGLKERCDAARRKYRKRVPRDRTTAYGSKAELAEIIRNAPSFEKAAQGFNVTAQALRSYCRTIGLDVQGLRAQEKVQVKGDDVILEATELASAEELMRRRGFSTDEWWIKAATVNEWGNDPETGKPYQQLKVHLTRRFDWAFPAVDPKPLRAKPVKRKASQAPQLVVLVSDHQAPYHCPDAQDAFLRFLEAESKGIHRVIHLGDLVDLPNVSRHRDSAVYNATVQDCINSGFSILNDIVQRVDCPVDLMVGNHDERLRTELLNRAERMFGIRPADQPGKEPEDEMLSLKRLLRLDDLHVDLVDDPAGFAHNRIRIGNLEVRHGWRTGPNAIKGTIDSIGRSAAVGHTHAKRSVWKLVMRNDQPEVHQGVEIGCMCSRNLGYNAKDTSDWHQGWATVAVWPDGLTNVDHATMHKGEAIWRSQRY